MSYTIIDSAGNTVGTIATATTNATICPITLIGQGISLYGDTIADDLYHMIEHFANTSPPNYAIDGLLWYNTALEQMSFFNGSFYIPLASSINNSAQLLSTTSVSFTSTGLTDLFDNTNDYTIIPTAILFMPTNVNVTVAPVFNMIKATKLYSLVNTSNVVTVTTSVPHNFIVGMNVTLANITQSQFNSTWTIATVPSSTTFTFSVPISYPGTGTGTNMLAYITEDILGSTTLDNPSNYYHNYYTIDGTTAFLSQTIDSVYLQVTSAASGGGGYCSYNAFLFGFTIQ